MKVVFRDVTPCSLVRIYRITRLSISEHSYIQEDGNCNEMSDHLFKTECCICLLYFFKVLKFLKKSKMVDSRPLLIYTRYVCMYIYILYGVIILSDKCWLPLCWLVYY
jgi:hypothetical protein